MQFQPGPGLVAPVPSLDFRSPVAGSVPSSQSSSSQTLRFASASCSGSGSGPDQDSNHRELPPPCQSGAATPTISNFSSTSSTTSSSSSTVHHSLRSSHTSCVHQQSLHPSPPSSKISPALSSLKPLPNSGPAPLLDSSTHHVSSPSPLSPPSSQSSVSPKSLPTKINLGPGRPEKSLGSGTMTVDEQSDRHSSQADNLKPASNPSSTWPSNSTAAPLPPISFLSGPRFTSFSDSYQNQSHDDPSLNTRPTSSYLSIGPDQSLPKPDSLPCSHSLRLRLPKPTSFASPSDRPPSAPSGPDSHHAVPSVSASGSASGGSASGNSPVISGNGSGGAIRLPSFSRMQIAGPSNNRTSPGGEPEHLPTFPAFRSLPSSNHREDGQYPPRGEYSGAQVTHHSIQERERYPPAAHRRAYSSSVNLTGGHASTNSPPSEVGLPDDHSRQYYHPRKLSTPRPPTGSSFHRQFDHRDSQNAWIDSQSEVSPSEIPKVLHYVSQCAENILKVTNILSQHLLPDNSTPESEERFSALLAILTDADRMDLLRQTRATHDSLSSVFKVIEGRQFVREQRAQELRYQFPHYSGVPSHPHQAGPYPPPMSDRRTLSSSAPIPPPIHHHQQRHMHPPMPMSNQAPMHSHYNNSLPGSGPGLLSSGNPQLLPPSSGPACRKIKKQQSLGTSTSSPSFQDQQAMPANNNPTGAGVKKKRGRLPPPTRCLNCNRQDTPEWRRGPDGARTLCNACGLHYAKASRRQEPFKTGGGGGAGQPGSQGNSSQMNGNSGLRNSSRPPVASGSRPMSRSRSSHQLTPMLAIDKALAGSGLLQGSEPRRD